LLTVRGRSQVLTPGAFESRVTEPRGAAC
jgi:hypothetical protein